MSGAWRCAGAGVILARDEVWEASKKLTAGNGGKVTLHDGIIQECLQGE